MNMNNKYNNILASPSIKRPGPSLSKDTDGLVNTGVHSVSLRDSNNTFSQSADPRLQYAYSDLYQPQTKQCSVELTDIFKINDTSEHFCIRKCSSKNCKTCPILLTDHYFKSNLTKITHYKKLRGSLLQIFKYCLRH